MKSTDFTYFVGWDSDILRPVVIHTHPAVDQGMWHGDGFKMAHSFIWFEQRYGPMRKMNVTNRDGHGEIIVNEG